MELLGEFVLGNLEDIDDLVDPDAPDPSHIAYGLDGSEDLIEYDAPSESDASSGFCDSNDSEDEAEGKRALKTRADLVRLGQTCRRLHRVVQPILYRDIIVLGPPPWGEKMLRKVDFGKLVIMVFFDLSAHPSGRQLSAQFQTKHVLWFARYDVGTVEGFLAAAPNLKTLEFRNFVVLRGDLMIAPPQLASLTLIKSHLSVASLSRIAHTCPRLSRISLYYEEFRPHWDPTQAGTVTLPWPADIVGALAPLSQTLEKLNIDCRTYGDCIEYLAAHGYEHFPDAAATVLAGPLIKTMAGFPALSVLGINYGIVHRDSQDALVDLIKGCERLRVLVVHDASTMPRDDLLRFARAASELRFPSLRKVTLVSTCRIGFGNPLTPRPIPGEQTFRTFTEAVEEYEKQMWDRLKRTAGWPVREMLSTGNVEMVLEQGTPLEDVRAKPFVKAAEEVGRRYSGWGR
ncbi:hypothetical protein MFIFM68171_10219 [Madurella fahalii]|uniref:F-box domain-containing protein n=1 Tax=Madurella fahalii TaxID=1157608 RepID=A0ABQ0GQI9_9PEZI